MRRWQVEQDEQVFTHRLFDLKRRALTSDGDRRQVMVLEAPDWINVVPVLPSGEILFIKQWRYGTSRFTLEIPGGMVEAGESHRQAALRELLEETGYQAQDIQLLGELDPNPAFQTNRVSTWLASGLVEVHSEALGDGSEEIERVVHSAAEVDDLIRSGAITHSLVVAAFHLYGLFLGRPK